MPARDQYTREAVINAIRGAKGKISLAAHSLKCTPQTIHNYVKRYKTVEIALREAQNDFSETMVDKAEVRLDEAIMQGKAWAIKYALATQGKTRGYTERQEVEHSGAVDVLVVDK